MPLRHAAPAKVSVRLLLTLSATLLAPAVLAQTDDPYLWLEDIHGAKPMATIKAWNAETLAALEASPGFAKDRDAARAILDDEKQITVPESAFGNTVRDFRRHRDVIVRAGHTYLARAR